MPRYYITTTTEHLEAHDDEGVVLPGPAALATLLRRTVALIVHDEGAHGTNHASAVAVDEAGRCVMSATIGLIVTES